jgi:hypothetical protein
LPDRAGPDRRPGSVLDRRCRAHSMSWSVVRSPTAPTSKTTECRRGLQVQTVLVLRGPDGARRDRAGPRPPFSRPCTPRSTRVPSRSSNRQPSAMASLRSRSRVRKRAGLPADGVHDPGHPPFIRHPPPSGGVRRWKVDDRCDGLSERCQDHAPDVPRTASTTSEPTRWIPCLQPPTSVWAWRRRSSA